MHRMPEATSIQLQMKELTCCVIIPTYNNAGTLEQVVSGVRQFTGDIIVVNDGSTDETAAILDRLSKRESPADNDNGSGSLTIITLSKNTGKGSALRQAFSAAINMGYRYAITLDSDGQHFPEDIPKFIGMISANPDSMIVGARNMRQKGVPGTSSFGHKFSIFWFWVETGLKIPDVQTGYRLYPLQKLEEIHHFYSTKYEFEVEVLVRLAWRGVSILSVPVKIWYGAKGEQVSHFRKGRDFARTSLLNTLLVFAALLWIRPFHFAQGLRKKSFKEIIRDYFINSEDTNARLAWSVTLGLFIGVSPFWGYQMIVAVALAHLFKLNKFVALVASNISIPPMIPVIIFLSYLAGGLALGVETSHLSYSSGISLEWIKDNVVQYIIGSFVLGAVLAPVCGLLTYILLVIFRKKIRTKELNTDKLSRD